MLGGGTRTGRTRRLAAARRARGPLVTLAVLFALAVTACGGGGSSDPTVLSAGQLDIKLPPGFRVVHGKVVAPATSAARSSSEAPTGGTTPGSASPGNGTSSPTTSTPATTIPLDKGGNPQTAMFTALSKFRACLDRDGVKFQGAPDQSNPNSPTNDPGYIKSLTKCAAESNIVAALKASQTAQDNLTPAQIEQQNKQYLTWRTCMIGRGWKVPQPQPDSKGRLFSFGTSGSQQGQSPIVAPPGKDILSSSDVQQCAAKAQKKK